LVRVIAEVTANSMIRTARAVVVRGYRREARGRRTRLFRAAP
jgi:hypothetical protein